MQIRFLAAVPLVLVFAGMVHAATPDWIQEFFIVRAPQTKVVRHPTDRGKYYLCWEEGSVRYGLSFRRSSLDDRLRAIRPGGGASLATIMPVSQGDWSAADEKICWG